MPREAVERDYAAGYLLASLAGHPRLGAALALKGGAALKKLYFDDDYRFSEDLDFSSLGPSAPRGDALEGAMREVADDAENRLGGREKGFGVDLERYTEKRAHPGGQEAFTFRFRFPWQRRPVRPLKVEVTQDELVLSPTDPRPLSHRYPEANPRTPRGLAVRSYSAEEVVSEKLLALLSTRDTLRQRGWTNGRSARDYYDLSRIAERYGPTLDRSAIRSLYARKAERRGLPEDPSAEDAFFADDLLADTNNQWDRRLGPVVPGGAPDRETTTAAVRRLVRSIFRPNP